MCITHVSATHIIHLYIYTCNTPTTPHMYYRCSTTVHILKMKVTWCDEHGQKQVIRLHGEFFVYNFLS